VWIGNLMWGRPHCFTGTSITQRADAIR